MTAIRPGATVGIFGGGQLGRMTAMAARSFGYRIQVLDPDRACPAAHVADHTVAASFSDVEGAVSLARHSDVVTLEIEKVAVASLEAAARHVPVRPGATVLAIIQDRARQKRWLTDHGFPVGEYRVATSAAELREAAAAIDALLFVKASHGGYDGRGQMELPRSRDAVAVEEAFRSLGAPCVVAERALDLERELSVMVARRPSGEQAVFPVAHNHHERRILAWSVTPAEVEPRIAREAIEIARGIAEAIAIEGLLAIELFLTRSGALLVNELAPRPHNSFHATERACATSQFEQLVRAVCDLPLGAVDVLRPAAIVNLLGDAWLAQPAPPDFAAALSVPGTRLHLYGKEVARPGRKMGHMSAIGDTVEEALARVQRAESLLFPI